jgi:O-antigen ligase
MNTYNSALTATHTRQSTGSAFFLLSAYLLLIFLRPFDFIPALKVLHLPMVAGGLCLVMYVMKSVSTGKVIFPRTPITKVLFVLSVWILLTIPFAFWVSNALLSYWNDWLKIVVLFLLLGNIIERAGQLRQAVSICILGAACVSIIAVALHVFAGESVGEGRLVTDASGLYSGPNYFSMTLILLLPYAIMFFFIDRRLTVRLAAGGVMALFTVTNMLTESRAGVLGEGLVVLLALWKLRNWGFSIVRTLGIVSLALVFLLPLAPSALWQRFSTLFVNYDLNTLDPTSATYEALTSKLEREELMVKGLILSIEHPILGVGMNNFSSASHAEWDTGSSRDWLGCHDTYLEISAELGVPGLLLYLGLLYAAFKTIRATNRQLLSSGTALPDSRDLRLLNDATTISFWGYVLFSAVAHLGYQPYFFVVAGLAQSLSNISMRSVPDSVPVASLAPVTAT